jgi:O-antigen/teichoic acid export membrane protein
MVFGTAFAGAVPMLIVLLAANLFLVPAQVLGSAVIAAGNPGAAARSQVLGLVITVPALIVLLPLFGGLGAAWVSLASYAASFGVLLVAAVRRFELSPRAFLLVSGADVRWLRTRLRRNRADAVGAPSSV